MGELARAARHPIPLALLAAGGVAGAAIAWPFAAAGAVAYLAGVTIAAVHGVRKAVPSGVRAAAAAADAARLDGAADICEPESKAVPVRSTELIAHVVRIRKAYMALYRALCESPPSVKTLFADTYRRMGEFVAHANLLAKKADQLRAHLDKKTEATRPEVRARLEQEYREATAKLVEVAESVESWQARVLQIAAEEPDEAERDSRQISEELERMDHLVRALEEQTRIRA